MSSSRLAGFVRLVPRIDPPRLKCGATSDTVNARVWVVSPATRFLNPSRTPTTSSPRLIASIVTDEITPLIPGAGPPPTTIASRPRDAEFDMGRTPQAVRSADARVPRVFGERIGPRPRFSRGAAAVLAAVFAAGLAAGGGCRGPQR